MASCERLIQPSPMTKLDLPDSIRKHQYLYSTFFFRSFAISQEPLIAFDHH